MSKTKYELYEGEQEDSTSKLLLSDKNFQAFLRRLGFHSADMSIYNRYEDRYYYKEYGGSYDLDAGQIVVNNEVWSGSMQLPLTVNFPGSGGNPNETFIDLAGEDCSLETYEKVKKTVEAMLSDIKKIMTYCIQHKK